MMFYTMKEHFVLIFIWVLSIVISITAYIGIQNVFPTGWDILLAHTLYAPLAMPNAFWHMMGIYADNLAHSDPFFFLLAAAYWVGLGASHYWYKEQAEGPLLLVIAFFLLSSSFKWLYFAEALIHAKSR